MIIIVGITMYKYILSLLLFSIRFTLPQQIEDESAEEPSLINFSDEKIEQELRRRSIEGLWSAGDAISILNQAVDLVSGSNQNETARGRKFHHQAESIIFMFTGEDSSVIELATD